MLADQVLITGSDRLYFAYGSHLSPENVAHRCPDSVFLGKATLRGYRWQVNERGLVNIVRVPAAPDHSKREKEGSRDSSSRTSSTRGRSQDHHRHRHHGINNHDQAVDTGYAVEGLVYAISKYDEDRLDEKYKYGRKGRRHEGATKDRYDKLEVKVDFEPVRGNVFARCTSASVGRAVRDERERGRIADILGVERRARSWDEGVGEGEKKRRGSGRREGGGGGGGGSRRGASVGASSSSSSSALAMGDSGLRKSIMGLLGIPTSKRERASSPSPARVGRDRTDPRVVGTLVDAVVYANTVYVRDGEVREDRVSRMEQAVADALALGVSRDFVEKNIAPAIPEVWSPRPGWKSSWRKSLVGGQDGFEKDKGRREVESMRRSVSRSDGLGRRGRRDSILDRRSDYYT